MLYVPISGPLHVPNRGGSAETMLGETLAAL